MGKYIYLISIFAIIVIALLFLAPQATLKSDTSVREEAAPNTNIERTATSTLNTKKLSEWKSILNKYGISEKYINFADSLVESYFKASEFDSALKYKRLLTVTKEKGEQEFAEFCFKLLEKQYFFGDVNKELLSETKAFYARHKNEKLKQAILAVFEGNVMNGVLAMKELVREDSTNAKALYYLGVLSIQSGQWDKAIEHMKCVTQLDSTHAKAWLYLGVIHLQQNREQVAKDCFERVRRFATDEELKEEIKKYLETENL